MAAWVRFSRGRLVYTGRITRRPFTEWTSSDAGSAAVELVASRIRFSLFGKANAARRRLWRELAAMARGPAVVDTIQQQGQAYLQRAGDLAAANVFRCVGMDLHRLFAVPRVFLNSRIYDDIDRELSTEAAFESLEGGKALREFFILRLLDEIHEAVARLQPSPKDALSAGTEWVIVGVNQEFVWKRPVLDDPVWHGHYYVLELTRSPVTRSVRKATQKAIEGLEASLPALSQIERNEILRRAAMATWEPRVPHVTRPMARSG